MNQRPKWFNLENYLHPMSKEEWAYHIYIRSKLIPKGKFNNNSLSKIFFSILTKGDFSKRSLLDAFREVTSEDYTQMTIRDLQGYKTPVEPTELLSIKEVVNRAKKLTDQYRYIIPESIREDETAQNKDAGERIRQMFEESIYGNTHLISYSLEHTDAEILKSIKAHLIKERSKTGRMFIFTETISATLDQFHKFRLLALFDLLYWKEFENPKLTYAMIGELVWPEDVIEVDQRIRKKGLPLIKAVFHRAIARKIYQNRN